MANMSDMKKYEFFTLDSTERTVDKEKGYMYLLIRPNQLKIRDIEKSSFFANITTLELVVSLKTLKVTNIHKPIMFADNDVSKVVKFDSTESLNDLKDFGDFLMVDSKRPNKWENQSFNSSQFKDEIEDIVEILERTRRDSLIEKALEERNKDLFDKLTS